MGVTGKWNLPYPESSTLISESAPIVQELAEKIDDAISTVTTGPEGPPGADGAPGDDGKGCLSGNFFEGFPFVAGDIACIAIRYRRSAGNQHEHAGGRGYPSQKDDGKNHREHERQSHPPAEAGFGAALQ